MKITIETTMPTAQYVTFTGYEICAMLDMAREMIRHNMGPEQAYSTSGPVYSADGNTVLATWRLEL